MSQTDKLRIKDIHLVPYISIKPSEKRVICVLNKIDALEMHFAITSRSEMYMGKCNISNPNTKIAMEFKASRGSKAAGLRPSCTYYIAADKIYRKMTWKDFNERPRATDIKFYCNKQIIFLVKEVEINESAMVEITTQIDEWIAGE